jgi:hypothetical protein
MEGGGFFKKVPIVAVVIVILSDKLFAKKISFKKCFGSGSTWIRIQFVVWIRIQEV